MRMHAPATLYKILSLEHWITSETGGRLSLSSNDDEFIHLATHEQLDRIIGKYWATVPQFVVLTVDPAQLPGELVLEANQPGGNQYYHLYNGFIPVSAILKAEMATPHLKHSRHNQVSQ